jgi:3-oxo-4-pregnene-20-carboxyl-CoA dehydrogenase alpha subunit
MNVDLTAEALAYGREASRALEAAGGENLIQFSERTEALRDVKVAPVLAGLGAWDLTPRTDPDDLEAAAALCRSAGYWCVPYPVAERLARPTDLAADGLVVVAGAFPATAPSTTTSAPTAPPGAALPAAAVSGIELRWSAVTLDGQRAMVVAQTPQGPPRTAAFVATLDLAPVDDNGADDVALALVLPCWTLLGMLDRAIDLTRAYVREREQFGQPLAAFQSVQFQLTDAVVERDGTEMLAKYALWSIQTGSPDALHDALALRMAAIEAAEITFRVAHQLHGAIGFCDEMPLSWLSRYSQPLRRLPLGLSATRAALTARIGRRGLTGLFNE